MFFYIRYKLNKKKVKKERKKAILPTLVGMNSAALVATVACLARRFLPEVNGGLKVNNPEESQQ